VEKEELEKRIKDLPFQQDELVALRAENERLTRERDEASTNLTTARLSNAMLAEELAELKAIMAEKRQGWKASRRLQAELTEARKEIERRGKLVKVAYHEGFRRWADPILQDEDEVGYWNDSDAKKALEGEQ
jgi:predicted RNase H-like nuclease (RuvC/YqgF family)